MCCAAGAGPRMAQQHASQLTTCACCGCRSGAGVPQYPQGRSADAGAAGGGGGGGAAAAQARGACMRWWRSWGLSACMHACLAPVPIPAPSTPAPCLPDSLPACLPPRLPAGHAARLVLPAVGAAVWRGVARQRPPPARPGQQRRHLFHGSGEAAGLRRREDGAAARRRAGWRLQRAARWRAAGPCAGLPTRPAIGPARSRARRRRMGLKRTWAPTTWPTSCSPCCCCPRCGRRRSRRAAAGGGEGERVAWASEGAGAGGARARRHATALALTPAPSHALPGAVWAGVARRVRLLKGPLRGDHQQG